MKRVLKFLALTTIAGCATGPLDNAGTFLPPFHYQSLEIADVCCASYKAIRYAQLQRGTEVKAIISTDAPVFEFNGRRSFFAAFELQPGADRTLIITTIPVNMLLNRYGHVMVPAVQFLDVDYKPIATIEPRYVADSRFPRGSWAETQVRVPNATRYALLFEGKNVGGLAWRDRDQTSGSLFVRSGPTGEISVIVSGS